MAAAANALIGIAGTLRVAEFSTWHTASGSLTELRERLFYNEVAPPAYYVILHFWLALGDAETWFLRLPSAVSAIALALATAWLGALLGGKRAGLAAGALVALSPFVALAGQRAQPGVLAALAATVAVAATLSAFRRESARGRLMLMGVGAVAAAGALTLHYAAAFAVAPLAVWVSRSRKLDQSLHVGYCLFLALAAIVPLRVLIGQLSNQDLPDPSPAVAGLFFTPIVAAAAGYLLVAGRRGAAGPVLAGALALSLGASAAVHLHAARDAGRPLLPDLAQDTPRRIGIKEVARPGGGTQYRLGFRSAVKNLGEGPLVVDGRRDGPTMQARQLVFHDGDQVTEGDVAGRLRFVRVPGHVHWHYAGFDRYELTPVAPSRGSRRDRKSGFCLGDRYATGGGLPGRPEQPTFRAVVRTDCGGGRAEETELLQGISVGWADDYKAQLEGQFIDVTGLPGGRYLLVHRVNADGKLRERTARNNAASVLLRLAWPRGRSGRPTVRVLDSCPESDRCAA